MPPPGWMSKTIAATAAIRGAPEAEARLREAPASEAKQVLVHPEEWPGALACLAIPPQKLSLSS